MDVVLVHGYNVTSTKTYGVLPQRLKSLGYSIKNLYLSKYITLDDDVTLPDLVKAFQTALDDVFGKSFGKSKFACITHSTGGLIARHWIDANYSNRISSIPISHLIMLAPPNHGSRLAGVGKSRLSRLRSLWGVEPGLKILDSLEVGSSYQWTLDSHWVAKKFHTAANFFPVVITGQWIDKHIWDVIIPATYERGSDGVVRAASANLNHQKFSIDVKGKISREELQGTPYLITSKTSHSDERFGIMGGVPAKGDHPVLSAITDVLDVKDKKGYQALQSNFSEKTSRVQETETYYDGSVLNRYSLLVVRVSDNMGNALSDYAIEIIDGDGRGDVLPSGFLAHSSQNPNNPELFSFYLNYDQISKVVGKKIGLRIQSTPHSPLIQYPEVVLLGDATQVSTFLQPNQTTYVDVVLRRRLNKNLFRLTKDLSYQKIKPVPIDDWIE